MSQQPWQKCLLKCPDLVFLPRDLIPVSFYFPNSYLVIILLKKYTQS